MRITLINFAAFIDGGWDYDASRRIHTGLFLRNKNADITGGKITKEDLDVLKNHPSADTLTVMGLNQDTFTYFIKTYGNQLRAIRFFKNKSVEDWSLLGTLRNLEFVYFFHNQRITHLWDMRANTCLQGIALQDFTKLHTLSGIEKAPALKWLDIGDAVWPKTEIDSFQCLAGTSITHFSFCGKKVTDMDLSFLLDMPYLETFDFFSNLYTTEQVAWMVANKPAMKGISLKPVVLGSAMDGEPAVMVVGRKKPFLQVKDNQAKIEKYTKDFYLLVEKYAGVPYKTAFPVSG